MQAGPVIVRAIVNPISGRRSMTELIEELRAELADRGYELEIGRSKKVGDAERFAARTPADTRAIVVCGGDGTLREVVQGINDKPVPLVVLPTGTENVLAKHFHYRADVETVVRAVTRGREIAYDVGICGNKRFFMTVGVGFDAEVARRVHEAREGHISYWSYVRPTLQAFLRYHPPTIRVEVDHATVFEGRAFAWVGVLPRYAIGTRILAKAHINDGLLDVCILPCTGRLQLLGHAARLLVGRHLRPATVQYHQCTSARVTAMDDQAVPIQIDGDYCGTLPVECGIIPSGVRFLLPQ
jgi:diacylglycerol kinase (ATP)